MTKFQHILSLFRIFINYQLRCTGKIFQMKFLWLKIVHTHFSNVWFRFRKIGKVTKHDICGNFVFTEQSPSFFELRQHPKLSVKTVLKIEKVTWLLLWALHEITGSWGEKEKEVWIEKQNNGQRFLRLGRGGVRYFRDTKNLQIKTLFLKEERGFTDTNSGRIQRFSHECCSFLFLSNLLFPNDCAHEYR